MSEPQDAYDPSDFVNLTDVGHPEADTIQFVTVPGEDKVFLYLWDSKTDSPVTSVVGFTAEGVEDLQHWLTNVDIEARQANISLYGEDND